MNINQFMLRLQIKRQNNPQYTPFNLILPSEKGLGKLFLGDVYSLDDRDFFAAQQIRTVLTCCPECKPTQRICGDAQYTNVVQINMKDTVNEDIYDHFATAYEVIEKGRAYGNVLVHCMAGVSRSASMVIAYIMRKQRKSYQEAFAIAKERRAKVNPNEGFVVQLLKFQANLKTADNSQFNGKVQITPSALQQVIKPQTTSTKSAKPASEQIMQSLSEQKKAQSEENTTQTRLERLKAEVGYMTLMMGKGKIE